MTEKEFYDQIGGDYREAVGRLMKDALVRKFVLKFKADPSYAGLKAAVEARDWETAFGYAHTLKGVVQNLAFFRLSAVSVTLTDALRPANREMLTAQQADAMLAAVTAEYETVYRAIDLLEAQPSD